MSSNFIHGTNFPLGSLPDHLKPKPINHTERFWSFLEECAFFSTTSGEAFLASDPHHAPGFLIPINHPSCRQFLCQQYSRRFGSSPPPGALRSALARAHDSARAAALRDFSPTLRMAPLSNPKAIAIRHGRSQGHWYLTAEGAFDNSSHETNFYAGSGSLPLPQPDPHAPAAALDDFFHLLRIPAGPARLRCLTWLLSAFRPSGPYPILILRGPSGSGKSFAARALRALTDPNDPPLLPLPPSPNQLRQLAYENWVLAFDHLTRFPRRTTESLARLTENEVHFLPPKRDPATVSLARPILLTAADSSHIPPDIAARALTVELPAMPDTERKTEAELQSELEVLLPQALARLLKAVGQALSPANPSDSRNRSFPLPRLADAAVWMLAAAPALGITESQILQSLSTPLDPLVERIAALMQNLEIWRGSATQLAADLNLDCDASQLSRELFQNQAALNALGFAITRSQTRLTRAIEITKLDKNLENAVTPSPTDDFEPPLGSAGGLAAGVLGQALACQPSAAWRSQPRSRAPLRPFPLHSPAVIKQENLMKRSVDVSSLLALIASVVGLAPVVRAQDQYRAMLTTYCFTCHSTRAKVGGLALEALDLHNVPDAARTWEKVLRKLRGHLMPPPGNPQPPQKNVDSFVSWMEDTLDAHPQGPKAGYVPIQRLNRTEYAASVKALVGVDVNPKDVLPQDIQVDGFDNISAALSVSPAFLDQYIAAARHVAKLAIGDPSGRVSNVKYLISALQNNDEPLPPGTRGGVRFKHNFPADGEYRINIDDLAVGLYTNTMENESTLVILLDGKIVFRKPIGGPADLALTEQKGPEGRKEIMERFSKIPVQVRAGVHDIVVAFIDRAHVESDENVAAGFGGLGVLGFGAGNGRMARLTDGIEIVGPFHSTGVSKTPSRALIFVCDPQKGTNSIGEAACAKQITQNLARRAFRRPVTDEDVARLMPFYEAGRQNGGTFDDGIEQVVAAVLASPDFLYRAIRGPKGTSPSTEFALTDLELASRLSFFLWNTGPDDELLSLAAAGGLTKPGAAEKQVRRMLADPKASSLVTSFAMKWLNLTSLDSVQPDPKLFPAFNEQLRHDFSEEAEAFIGSIFLQDRSVFELLTSNHTFLNDRLARLYGVPGIIGNQFREVVLSEQERAGLLGKAAVLLRSSYGDRTSPVLRGAWVLDKLLGTPPTPPPPNTATDLSQKAGETPKTVRARLEQHRNKASCNQCHGVIDPTGLALENFDAIGEWRTIDRQANAPIDAKTVLPNGVAIDGPVELRAQLVERRATFAEAFTEKLMMYAINRELEYFDMPQVRAVVRAAAKDNYKFSSIVLGIVNTDAFRKQGRQAAPNENVVKSAAAK